MCLKTSRLEYCFKLAVWNDVVWILNSPTCAVSGVGRGIGVSLVIPGGENVWQRWRGGHGVTTIPLSLIEGKCKCQRCLKKKCLLASVATWNKLWQMEKALYKLQFTEAKLRGREVILESNMRRKREKELVLCWSAGCSIVAGVLLLPVSNGKNKLQMIILAESCTSHWFSMPNFYWWNSIDWGIVCPLSLGSDVTWNCKEMMTDWW